VVIETTGLADPGPVAQTFFMDDEVAEQYLLDSILTLVDAKHAAQQLNDRQEARRQVGFADQIFISKADLVSPDEVDALIHRLKHMNPRAPMRPVHFGEVALEVFDLRGFNLNAKLDIDPDFLKVDDARWATTMAMTTTTTTTTMSTASTATTRRTHGHDTVTTITTTTTSRASSSGPSALRPGQAGGLPGRHRQHLRSAHAALQGRAAHAGHRPQGDLPGRAPAHGQRPGPAWAEGEARTARWCSSASTCPRTSWSRAWSSAWSDAAAAKKP
jgi:G3E family GTPase